jgi:RNA-directed DNA polymerase
MTESFTDLYERACKHESFSHLYELITSRENIRLAYRTMKSNKGSKTPGIDKKTITDIEKWSEDELIREIQNNLKEYSPKKFRRKFIEKDNGKWRPLGIPCILDRIIQQCFKQVLEPIAEAHFYKHSYGFRPLRSTHHAMARVQFLVNRAQMHYVVDIDILGFFDNVNHTLLLKQLWNMGIQDRRVLACISKMLKAEIDGEGIPTRGVPQRGLLSTLLSNVVLNDLDHWIADQWEFFPLTQTHKTRSSELYWKNRTSLKEGYMVRYADDFKVICRDYKTAYKWYHAVISYLKNRLKLEVSPEKSQVINLRKRESEFLGFTIRANKKGKIRVAHTGIKANKKQKIRMEAKKRIQKLRSSPIALNAALFNSFVLGIHNYFSRATHVSVEFSRLAYDLRAFMYNRLKQIGKYEHPTNPPPTYSKFYSMGYRTFKVADVYLYPLANVKTKNTMNFSQSLSLFTTAGREQIHKKLRPDIRQEILSLMESRIPNQRVEYMDNRISRYSMKMGKCEITGMYLFASDDHCHHFIPLYLGGSDKFNNMRILHKDVYELIHHTQKETIEVLRNRLGITNLMEIKINQYRDKYGLEPV